MIKLLLLFLMSSCAQYINGIHRQIDREQKKTSFRQTEKNELAKNKPSRKNPFNKDRDKRPIKNPITYSLGSGPSGQIYNPPKRVYAPKRYNANDFRDNDESGSIWANQGSSASLFTYQNEKHTGDMIIINVLENLRNQISSELKRIFPEKPKTSDNSSKQDAKPQASTTSVTNDDMDMKVYDKISGTVMEEISKDYILLKGRKDVIFKKEKKSIEVQALVSRKDIMENDYVNSDKLLESKVFILKENQ